MRPNANPLGVGDQPQCVGLICRQVDVGAIDGCDGPRVRGRAADDRLQVDVEEAVADEGGDQLQVVAPNRRSARAAPPPGDSSRRPRLDRELRSPRRRPRRSVGAEERGAAARGRARRHANPPKCWRSVAEPLVAQLASCWTSLPSRSPSRGCPRMRRTSIESPSGMCIRRWRTRSRAPSATG